MIKTEIVTINGLQFEHIYSDENRQVCRDGQSWDEVYNPLNTGRTYTEGDLISIEDNSIVNEEEISAVQILDILLGEDND